MNDLEIYNNEIEKIKLIVNRAKSDDSILSILLFRDYLSKLFNWKKKLGNDSEFIKKKECHNLFIELGFDLETRMKSLSEFNNDLKSAGVEIKGGKFFDDIFLYLITYWNIYKNDESIKKIGIESPYDSISKILERTTNILIINGQYQIGNITFNNIEKYKNFILPSLDDNFLDFIEKKYVAISKIPNQQEIDNLWKEFQNKNLN